MNTSPQISCISGTVEGRLQPLQRMVQSVRNSVTPYSYEIILVACECSEKTLSWIREQPDCVLVVRPKREGSVVAFNDGFSRAQGKYAVTLNDDIKVDGDTIARSYAYLEAHPEVGQVAYGHRYQNRGGNTTKPKLQYAFRYLYGQCCMTRTWLGEIAGWWGDYGLVHYGGDTHLSMRIWELGYTVVGVDGCSVTDWEIEDETRQLFSHQMRKDGGGVHPDLKLFQKQWNGRLPSKDQWRPAPVDTIVNKAVAGELRTLRFKSTMGDGYPTRVALINAFSEYGPAFQANQTWAMKHYGGRDSIAAQQWYVRVAQKNRPDLVMLQGQRPNNIKPATAVALRKAVPNAFVFNWDADTHYPMLDFHAAIARSVDLQLTISPDLFSWYRKRGVHHIGYWPIGVEQEFLDARRYDILDEEASWDVTFLGTLYGEGKFPEAETRRDAVIALKKSSLTTQLYGFGWQKVGLEAGATLENFSENAGLYCHSKMALSISQTAEYWGYTSDRAYNIMATGCPILVQQFNGMEEHGLVDGETCIAWGNIPEMLDKSRYYKYHPVEREAIGCAGRDLIIARHTWKRRVVELFGLIGGLYG